MKTRSGFVSNSSSSSFIITADGLKDNKFVVEIDMGKACPDGSIVTTVEELNKWFVNEFHMTISEILDGNESMKSLYRNHVKQLENKKVLFMGSLEIGQERLLNGINNVLENYQ